jgi:hypothetical protein
MEKDAPTDEQQRQEMRLRSAKKTLIISIATNILLLSWSYTALISKSLFCSLLVYLCTGYLANAIFGVPTASDLALLNFRERLVRRTFHAWLWPIYLMYFIRRK